MAKSAREHSTRATRSDPVFAALDNPRKLDRSLDLAKLEEAGSPGVTRYDVERGSAVAEEAAWKFAQTEPTTAVGAAAMLDYITIGPITGLFELGETNWHETAFRTVVASLAKITSAGKAAFAAEPAGHPGGFYLRRPPLAFVIAPLFQKGVWTGDRYCEVVQCDQGVWIYPARQRRQGCVRAHLGGRKGRPQQPQ